MNAMTAAPFTLVDSKVRITTGYLTYECEQRVLLMCVSIHVLTMCAGDIRMRLIDN